ncbi:MAG: hypothetical protein HQL79_09330 [Magnetococcales bacterium]|nr:hypothetical protein [Magnetococcales bacterium]
MQFPIRRGDKSSDVVLVQNRLNRRGALLKEDGRFGGVTEEALAQACSFFNMPPVHFVDQEMWNRLDALPEPTPLLPTWGVTFIALEEVSSRSAYDALYSRPTWPSEESGITIGIGYDLKFAKDTFQGDWQALLDPDTYSALVPWLGKTGSREGKESLKHTRQPFEAAWNVYLKRTIPNEVHKTQKAFPGYEALSPLCKSALVSLVYNRGTSLVGPRRVEMRAIHDLIQEGHLDGVPDQLIAMKRLWPDLPGLRSRREHEAELWKSGL